MLRHVTSKSLNTSLWKSSLRLFSTVIHSQSKAENALMVLPSREEANRRNFNYKWIIAAISLSAGYYWNSTTDIPKTCNDEIIVTDVEFDNLFNRIKNAKDSDYKLELVLYKNDNNASIKNFDQLLTIFNEIFKNCKLSTSNIKYFVSFFEMSVKKYVTTYHELSQLYAIYNTELMNSIINLLSTETIEKMIFDKSNHYTVYSRIKFFSYYIAFLKLSKEMLRKVILDNQDSISPDQRVYKICTVRADADRKNQIEILISYLSDEELKSIFNSIDSIITYFDKTNFTGNRYYLGNRLNFCNRLGRKHIENLLDSTTPLKRKDFLRMLPPIDEITENEKKWSWW